MSLRGKAAIVGIGETPHKRSWPGRSALGLCAEVAAQAINDAGLRREDIDGLITMGGIYPARVAEYIGVRPWNFAVSAGLMGSTSGVALTIAAMAVSEGIANYVLFVAGGARDPDNPQAAGGFRMEAGFQSEWFTPYGPAAGANTYYGLLYTRHMYEYGTKPEQMAQVAVNQRFNAAKNPLAAMRDPITVEDVLNSRYVNYPLHLLETVMPVAGAIAFIVTTAERAKTLRKPPVYLLGAGVSQGYDNHWYMPDMTITPTVYSAPKAYAMAGYGPKDMQFAEFYDCYTILVSCCLEDAGLIPKGEAGPFFESVDTTYKGTFPINTDGGQLSAGQLNGIGASGCQQLVEAVRQIRGEAGERQVAKHDLCVANMNGGTPSQEVTVVLGSANAL
ncbi:MAG TPA: thiolase family protein [Dehalococcoidia bacterium]|nr:thiolase family protein [Dehalococcoidia bacterium]